jgi:hypothetical protein
MNKLGRNDPCHCGSGLKYKRCHLPSDQSANVPRILKYEVQGSIQGGLPGTYADVVLSPLGEESVGPYTVVFALARFDEPLRTPQELAGHEQLGGDSHLAFAWPGQPYQGLIQLNVVLENGSVKLVDAVPNENGRLAKLLIRDMEANSYEEARAKASRLAFDLLSNISLMYDIPVEVYQVEVIDQTSGSRYFDARMPFSTGVWDTPIVLGGEIKKYAALYREGIASKSDFYAYLCFYKIIEAVSEANALSAKSAVSEKKAPPRLDRHILPESDDEIADWVRGIFPGWYVWGKFELANVAPREARGKKLGAIREQHLSHIRNAIAHGLLAGQGLIDVDDPALHHRVKYWLPYTRMMARRLAFSRCFPASFQPS